MHSLSLRIVSSRTRYSCPSEIFTTSAAFGSSRAQIMMSAPELNLQRERPSETYARPFPALLSTLHQNCQHAQAKRHVQLRKMFMVVMVRVKGSWDHPLAPRDTDRAALVTIFLIEVTRRHAFIITLRALSLFLHDALSVNSPWHPRHA